MRLDVWSASTFRRFITRLRAPGTHFIGLWVGSRHDVTPLEWKMRGAYRKSWATFFFFACELGRADEGECGGRWNQLLCYPWVSCDVNSLHRMTNITPNKMADNDMSFRQRAVIPCERGNPCCRNSPETSACLWKCVHGCEQCSKVGETF